jgi:hypothetical protein
MVFNAVLDKEFRVWLPGGTNSTIWEYIQMGSCNREARLYVYVGMFFATDAELSSICGKSVELFLSNVPATCASTLKFSADRTLSVAPLIEP